mgnify:FL=1
MIQNLILKLFSRSEKSQKIGYKLLKINDLIAKSKNGTEIIVSLIPLNKMQNTRQGLQQIEVGKRVLLQSGIVVDLNLDGRTFYTSSNQIFKLNQRFM